MLSVRPFSTTLSVCSALLLAALPAVGQDTASAFGEVIDVRVVNLEVVVTEKGERVRGLSPDDFELRVDKQVVPIEYFTEVSGGTAVARDPDDGSSATLPALAPGEAVGTSYLVFVDDFFTLARDRDQVLDNLLEQLPNLQPHDRMAVVAFDGQTVDMLSNWTHSIPALNRALRKAKTRKARGLERLTEQRLFDQREEINATQPRDPQDRLAGVGTFISIEEEQMAARISGQVKSAVRAATATLRGFANPPGRRVMLLLSGGWPHDPVRWAVAEDQGLFESRGIDRAGELFDDLSRTANRLSYTIYSVDMPGVTYQATAASVGTELAAERARDASLVREREEERALVQLADDTGGRALLNGLRLGAFEQAVADTRSYYWLGFTPSWQGDDTEHDIEIRVKGKGRDVRSRESYSDLSRSTEVTMMVESALLFGDAPGAGPLEVTVGRGRRSGIGRRDVPLKVSVPLHEVTFLPAADGFATQLELRIAVLDSDGNQAEEIPVIPFGFTAPRAPTAEEQAFVPYKTQLRMRNKKHTLVVSVYDLASGKILTGRTQVLKR